jgi:hypothetical protein
MLLCLLPDFQTLQVIVVLCYSINRRDEFYVSENDNVSVPAMVVLLVPATFISSGTLKNHISYSV